MENIESELELKEYGNEIALEAAKSAYLTLIKRFIKSHSKKVLFDKKVYWGGIESLKIKKFESKREGVGNIYSIQTTSDDNQGNCIRVNYETNVYSLLDSSGLLRLIDKPEEEAFWDFSRENRDKLKFSTWESWKVYCDCIFPVSSLAEIYFGPRTIEIKRNPHNRGSDHDNQIIDLDL